MCVWKMKLSIILTGKTCEMRFTQSLLEFIDGQFAAGKNSLSAYILCLFKHFRYGIPKMLDVNIKLTN